VVLISVGRLISGKEFEFLIDGFNEAIKEVQNLKLIIIGDGVLKSKLEKKVAKLGIQDKVIFAGRINHKELLKHYSTTDIFLLLSSYENFSNAVLEAMSCGLPIVVTNVGGIPEVVKDGKNGFLIKPKDPVQIAEKVLLILNNRELKQKFLNNNKEEVEKYSLDNVVEKLEKIYINILSKNKLIFANK
jgi:glycosyltransferase involved in cell wall biosynthesis